MTRKHSLSSTLRRINKQTKLKQGKCDSIEIHVITMCFKLDANTDAELNKITALSLIINKSQLGYVLSMFLRSGSISASTFLSKKVLKKKRVFLNFAKILIMAC